jgi:signal recognition particle subunit SEC65
VAGVASSYRKLVPTSFKVDVETLEELNETAKALGMERSELIRRAVRWYLWYIRNSQKPRLSDSSYGRIVFEKVKSRSRVSETIRGYIDFMYEKLLEWLDEDEVWYGSFDEMLEDAIEYIYDELARAPEHLTPCDNGVLATTMFADYVFDNRLGSDSDIADDLNGWLFDPEH